jgi:hypothetical protein
MASWMVHLRLADNLLGLIDGLDEAQFGIGNIAPDSGIPDEKWESFSPPPRMSHFYAEKEAAFPSQDLEFYRRYLQELQWPNDRPQRYSFRLGYFFHLVTDNLWHVKIDQPTRVRYPFRYESDPDFIWEVKRDWYGLDFIFARNHPDTFFWRVFIESEYTEDYLDFMPVEAVAQRIQYVKDFYQREDEKVAALYKRRFKFLTKEKMDNFVEKTTERLHQIYGLLWGQKQAYAEEYNSALEIPV